MLKKIIFSYIIILFSVTESFSETKIYIKASVENEIITNYDIQKEIRYLQILNKDLNVPSPAEYGINKEDFIGKLDILSKQAIDSGSPANNPIVPSHNQIKDLYLKLWS